MIALDHEGRKVEITGVRGRYEDDITVDECWYVDSDEEVSDASLEYIYDHYGAELFEMWHEHQRGLADSWMEREKDL